MHNTFKDLIVMILNVLVQFVLVIILAKSEIPTAIALALLVVGFMIYYIHHASQGFVAPEDGDEQPDDVGQPNKKYHEGWAEENTPKK